MNRRDLYEQHYSDNHIQAYHGIEYLDGLKNLSETAEPLVARKIFEEEYNKSVINLGSTNVSNFGERLYFHLNGDSSYEIIEELNRTVVKDRHVVILKIKFPYFDRVQKYFNDLGIRIRIHNEFNIYDIQYNGGSLLEDYCKNLDLSDPSMTHSSYSFETPWIMNSIQWSLTNHGYFYMPYNGIDASTIIRIIDEMKPSPSRYNTEEDMIKKQVDYMNRVLISSIDRGPLYYKYAFLTQAQLDSIDKDMEKTMNDLW